MSQHHPNLTKESAVLLFFPIFFSMPLNRRNDIGFEFSSLLSTWSLHYESFPLPSSPFDIPYLMQYYLLDLANCIISYSGSLLTAVSKLKLSFCFPFCCLPTLFCHFCTLSCQLFISLYSRVLWFLFPLLCLPLQLELSNQIPLFLLLLSVWATECFRKLSFSVRLLSICEVPRFWFSLPSWV